MKKFIEKYFNEQWIEIDCNVDFTQLKPFKTASSLHVYEERYEVNNETYRLLYCIGDETAPMVEILMK